MNQSFIDRLLAGAGVSKEGDVLIKPARTYDSIPELFRLPETVHTKRAEQFFADYVPRTLNADFKRSAPDSEMRHSIKDVAAPVYNMDETLGDDAKLEEESIEPRAPSNRESRRKGPFPSA